MKGKKFVKPRAQRAARSHLRATRLPPGNTLVEDSRLR